MFAALAAALVLVLQGLASAWANDQMPLLDAFGNPICQDSRTGSPSPGDSHGLAADCCALACHAGGTAFTPPTASLPATPVPHASALSASRFDAPAPARPEHNPASPRAPPPTI